MYAQIQLDVDGYYTITAELTMTPIYDVHMIPTGRIDWKEENYLSWFELDNVDIIKLELDYPFDKIVNLDELKQTSIDRLKERIKDNFDSICEENIDKWREIMRVYY